MITYAILTRSGAIGSFKLGELYTRTKGKKVDTLPGTLKLLQMQVQEMETKRRTTLEGSATVKKIRPRIRLVLQLLETGLKPKEVAKMTGYTVGRVQQLGRMNNIHIAGIRAEIQRRVVDSITDVGNKIKAAAGEALDAQLELMRQNGDLPTRRLASKFILEVAGYSPVRRQATISAVVPTDEFVAAVQKMDKSDEVQRRAGEWVFQLPEANSDRKTG